MDSSYRLEKVNEYSTRDGILLWRDIFYPKEAKCIYSYGSLSRTNTHAVGSSGSMAKWWLGKSLSLQWLTCFRMGGKPGLIMLLNEIPLFSCKRAIKQFNYQPLRDLLTIVIHIKHHHKHDFFDLYVFYTKANPFSWSRIARIVWKHTCCTLGLSLAS